MLAAIAARDYGMRQYDVLSAFLQGELKEEVYMRQPLGLRGEQEGGHWCADCCGLATA